MKLVEPTTLIATYQCTLWFWVGEGTRKHSGRGLLTEMHTL